MRLLLDSEHSNERAVREIAQSAKLLAEARAALPTLEAQAKAPAGDEGVGRVVGKRLALFGVNLTPEASAAWWSDYLDCLADLPEAALEAGMRAHIRSGAAFMPKPGELRNLALTTVNPAVKAFERARAALEWQPPKTYDPTPVSITPRVMRQEPPPEDKQRVRQMFADFAAHIETRKKPVESPFKCKAKVDETGITPELRAVMERRAEDDAA